MRKTFKKAAISVVLAIVLVCALVLPSLAANYEHLADDLNELGLFQGTGNGYALDRAPTRAEAVTMLIRFLGLEDEAMRREYVHPFTDVPDWASPYVALAFERGYTTGTALTTFSPQSPCNAQMYATYILRALGYSDNEGGDFLYAGAIEFAKSIGIIDDFLAGGTFKRDEMVAVSYLALNIAPKGGEYDSLLDKLISDGAVDVLAAKTVFEKYELVGEYLAASAALGDLSKVSRNMSIDIEASFMGQAIVATLDMVISKIIDNNGVLAEILMDADMMGEAKSIKAYIVDGFVYMDDGVDKTKTDAGLSSYSDMLSIADMSSFASSPVYLISDISKATEGGYTVFTITYADGFLSVISDLAMSLAGSANLAAFGNSEMSINSCAVKIYVNSSGVYSKTIVELNASISTDALGATLTIPASMVMEIEITATGDAVVIKIPDDLDKYVLAE